MSVFFKIDFFPHFFFNQIYCNIKYSTISIKDKLLVGCYCFFPLDGEKLPSPLPSLLAMCSVTEVPEEVCVWVWRGGEGVPLVLREHCSL